MKRLHIFFLLIPFLTSIFGTKAPVSTNKKPAVNKKSSPVKPMAKSPIKKPNEIVDEDEDLSLKKIVVLLLGIWVIINVIFLIWNYFQVTPYENQIKILKKQGKIDMASVDDQPLKDIDGKEYKSIQKVGDLKDHLEADNPLENKLLRYTIFLLSHWTYEFSGKKLWSTIDSK
jgi:hypothetical protein